MDTDKTKIAKRFTFQWIIRDKLKSILNDFQYSRTYQMEQVHNDSNNGQIIHSMRTAQQHCRSTFSENRLIRIDGSIFPLHSFSIC